MVDDRHFERMNQELDGANAEAESAALREHLEENAESRRLFEDLRGVHDALSAVTDVPPPPGLKVAVLEQLASSRPAGRSHAARRGTFVRMGYAFAAGLALGALLTFWSLSGSAPGSGLSGPGLGGALSPGAGASSGAPPWARGRLSGDASGALLEVELGGEGSMQIQVTFEPGSLELVGISGVIGLSKLELGDGRITWSGAGSGTSALRFARGAGETEVELTVSSTEGRLLYRDVFPLLPEGRGSR